MSQQTTWRDETRTLLRNRPVSLSVETIAEKIGVTKSWVNLFAAGKIENPGVNTIEALNRLLKSN